MATAAVSVDVTRAFDHVSLPLLLGLVEPLLRAPHYLVVKYCEVRGDAGWWVGLMAVFWREVPAVVMCC